MQALEVNPRQTYVLDDWVVRQDGTSTYDFLLTTDAAVPRCGIVEDPRVHYAPGDTGWIMLDVSNN